MPRQHCPPSDGIRQPSSPIPWLQIADVVAGQAKQISANRLGILGTRYLMEGPVCREVFDASHIEWAIPPATDRQVMNDIIFDELVFGRASDETRNEAGRIIEKLRTDQSCAAIVLACTELPLAVAGTSATLPILDSTRLLGRAALDRSIGGVDS